GQEPAGPRVPSGPCRVPRVQEVGAAREPPTAPLAATSRHSMQSRRLVAAVQQEAGEDYSFQIIGDGPQAISSLSIPPDLKKSSPVPPVLLLPVTSPEIPPFHSSL